MKKGLWFVLGAAAGSFVTWYIMRKRNEEVEPEEEIDYETIKENYSQNKEEEDRFTEEVLFENMRMATSYTDKPPLVNYVQEISKNNYSQNDIYVISPDQFGEIDDYERCTLTYYADGTLADENDDIVDDIEETVVEDFADHFGEYEEDSVYVRNDIRNCDYEILTDLRTYDEVLKLKPKPVEVE